MTKLTHFTKPIIAATLVVGALTGVAFAVAPRADEPTAQPAITHLQTNTSTPSADQPSTSAPRQTAQETVQTPDISGAASVSTPTQVAPVQAQVSAQATTAPAEPATPPTVINTIGSGVTSNARPYIDSFTCTYQFSDGTSQSRSVMYGKDELDHAAAVCPSWE